MYKIMIVEDDQTITDVLGRQLERWGYAVCVPDDFAQIDQEFLRKEPDLVLMDISLPYYDGYHWCEEIRRCSHTPIIFISSAGEDMNQVMALHMGADDFIAKPFSMEVLIAKIQAVLRRAYAFGGDKNVLRAGGAVLNLTEASLSFGSGRLELSKNEFKILQILMEHPGSPVSRDALIEKLARRTKSPADSEDYIAASIEAMDAKEILLCGDLKDEATRKVMNSLKEKCARIEISEYPGQNSEALERAGERALVFLVQIGKTTRTELQRELEVCRMQKIGVLGAVVM